MYTHMHTHMHTHTHKHTHMLVGYRVQVESLSEGKASHV